MDPPELAEAGNMPERPGELTIVLMRSKNCEEGAEATHPVLPMD